MKTIAKNKPFTFEKLGSFGSFVTGDSLPIDFLMTSLELKDLTHLSLARDVRPKKLDFELLMQRDINEDRVNREIVKYLNPKQSLAEMRSRPVFFPPLLAAVIPVVGKEMQANYPDEKVGMDDELVTRDWDGLMRLSFLPNETGTHTVTATQEGQPNYRVDLSPAKIELKEASEYGAESGVRLIVIDGQHRLLALKKVAKAAPDLLKHLVLPVCIVIAPSCTQQQRNRTSSEMPGVPEVFRKVFVDVNKTAEVVGGHFNILLSDATIGELACRIFCQSALQACGEEGLATIEWNIRSKKDSTKIQRKYSLTSIGVLELALRRSLGARGKFGLLKHVLHLSAVEQALYPPDTELDFPRRVEWDKFSFAQKEVLEPAVRDHLVAQLLKLFFKTREFAKALEIFTDIVGEYTSAIKEQREGHELMQAVLAQVLEYIAIAPNDSNAQRAYSQFEKAVEGRRAAEVNEIIKYAIFQRAMIDAWLEIVDMARSKEPHLTASDITSGFVVLLDEALERQRGIFSHIRRYMQHSVFIGSNIRPAEGTRTALSNLILASLGNMKLASHVVRACGSTEPPFLAALTQKGSDAAALFAAHYKLERMSSFKDSFATDFSIPAEDREELQMLQEQFDRERQEVRDKKRSKSEVSDAFDKKIGQLVREDVSAALEELRDTLGFETEIVVGIGAETDEALEED